MRVTTGTEKQSSKLEHAILVYSSFVTIHDVANQADKVVIQPGTLATSEALRAALQHLMPEQDTSSEFIPETLLAKGIGYMVWWVKPARRTVWFRCQEMGPERSGEVPNPGLIMAVTPSSWHLWAVKGTKRPDLETKLYQAPYFNVYGTGSLCTGSIDMPRDTDFFNTSKWEQAFFGSFFTHPNVHEAGRLIKEGSCYRFWLDMLDGKYKTFPAHQLVDSKTTLADVLTQLKKG